MTEVWLPEGKSTRDLYTRLLEGFSPKPLPEVNAKDQAKAGVRLWKKLDPKSDHSEASRPAIYDRIHVEELSSDKAREALLRAVKDLEWQRANPGRDDIPKHRLGTLRRWNGAVRKAKWKTLSPLCKGCHAPVFAFICTKECRPTKKKRV